MGIENGFHRHEMLCLKAVPWAWMVPSFFPPFCLFLKSIPMLIFSSFFGHPLSFLGRLTGCFCWPGLLPPPVLGSCCLQFLSGCDSESRSLGMGNIRQYLLRTTEMREDRYLAIFMFRAQSKHCAQFFQTQFLDQPVQSSWSWHPRPNSFVISVWGHRKWEGVGRGEKVTKHMRSG